VLAIDIPPDATIESLVTEVVPSLHARCVPETAPGDPMSISVRVEGPGRVASYRMVIRGRELEVEAGEDPRPTLWVFTTEATLESLLRDALGPRRLVPTAAAGAPAVTLTDPRLVRRVAMASGRIEIAVHDDHGTRLAAVFGFGVAARRPIDPDRPETVAEGTMATLQRVLRGEIGPEEALSSGAVSVRGSRLLAAQLALAIAPFFAPVRDADAG